MRGHPPNVRCEPQSVRCGPPNLRCDPPKVRCGTPDRCCDPPNVRCEPPKVRFHPPNVRCEPPNRCCEASNGSYDPVEQLGHGIPEASVNFLTRLGAVVGAELFRTIRNRSESQSERSMDGRRQMVPWEIEDGPVTQV